MSAVNGAGPLSGLRVLEFAGMGPAPFAAMLLADMGADVVALRRAPGGFQMPVDPRKDPLERGKTSVEVDLKSEAGRDLALTFAKRADLVLEGFRPGVMERLGLGPKDLWGVNPKIVYGRMTGWGQEGPLSQSAGHDPTYIGITGALHAIGRRGAQPQLPLSLVGDFGGGAMYLVAGVLAALWEAARSGRGQVVDAAIVDGVAHMMAPFYAFLAAGHWVDDRGSNLMDSGMPFIDTYATADGKYMVVAAMEEPFYQQFVRLLGVEDKVPADRWDPGSHEELRAVISEAFASRTRDEWTAVFEGKDACVGPVLSLVEAPTHPHLSARGTFFPREDGTPEPSPAPRFSRTPSPAPRPPDGPGDTPLSRVLSSWGIVSNDLREQDISKLDLDPHTPHEKEKGR